MKTILLENFRFGLDTRRSAISSSLGTLTTLENGFVNQGAEIESRKAFVKIGTLPANCFDLVALPTGLVTFGSVTTPTFTGGLVGLVSYQRLRHPWVALVNDGLLDPAMSGVTTSGAFNGKTFVAASFSAFTGSIISSDFSTVATNILFYDTSPVVQHYLGTVLAKSGFRAGAATDQWVKMAHELAGAMSSYFGTDYVGTFIDPSYCIVTGPANQDFALTTSYSTATTNYFTLDAKYGAAAKDPIVAVGATTSIFLTGGTSGSINTLVDSNALALISSAVNYSSSLLQTAILLAAAINAKATGYTATATLIGTNKAQVLITAPTIDATSYNTVTITVNTTTIKVAATAGAGGAAGNLTVNLAGGVALEAATPQVSYLLFYGTNSLVQWNYLDTWKGVLTANNINYTFGGGNIVNTTPTFCLGLGTKMYFCAGNSFYFSAVSDPTKWEQQDTGAGFQPAFDQTQAPSSVVSLANYQGKLAVFCNRNIIIYNVNADPTLNAQSQNLANIGTMAPLSPQAIGEEDVLFLASSGVRSLRVRDASLNALVVDIGSPIDALITAALNTAGSNTGAFGIVEPTSSTYWLYLKGTFYVLSYFPTLKITAWSTFKPTYITNLGLPNVGTYNYTTITGATYYWRAGNADSLQVPGVGIFTQDTTFVALGTMVTVTTSAFVGAPTSLLYEATPFTPIKAVVYNNQIYLLTASGDIYLYGGTNNTTYDGSVVTVQTPWLDDKRPSLNKGFVSVDLGISGLWQLTAGSDPISGTLEEIATTGEPASPDASIDSTYDKLMIPYISNGTHYCMKAQSDPTNVGIIKLSTLSIKYEPQDEK